MTNERSQMIYLRYNYVAGWDDNNQETLNILFCSISLYLVTKYLNDCLLSERSLNSGVVPEVTT